MGVEREYILVTCVENHYDDWHMDDVANTIRTCGATCGGGGEVLIVQDIDEKVLCLNDQGGQ